MSNIIQFLETAGCRSFSAAEYNASVTALNVVEPVRNALLARDHASLNDLLGGRRAMFFGICAPQEEPAEDDEVPAENEPDELPQ